MPTAPRSFWTLDPEVAFLNHGSYGACAIPVLEAQARWRVRMEREPVRFFKRDFEGLLDGAREAVARFVNADPEGLAFVANATTGVNAVLGSLDLGPGDEVVTTDHVYPACRNALDHVAGRRRVRVVVAPVPFPLAGPGDVEDAVLRAVGPRTRLALLDHVTSPTGLVFPIERLVRRLAERGVDALVDGAHAPGMLALDLRSLGAAYYTGNLHKWVAAPKGSAFLHVRADRREGVRPPVISHGWASPRTDRSRFLLEFGWTGTDDPSAWLATPDAIAFLGGLLPGGWTALRERNRALLLEGRRTLLAALGVPPPAPESMLGFLASVPLPDGAPDAPETAFGDPLQTALVERHRIQVPVVAWPEAPRRLVRISAHAYNEPAEYERLAAALTAEI
jgi:isopenicillin-N epimerase